jgi:hypothetical protein
MSDVWMSISNYELTAINIIKKLLENDKLEEVGGIEYLHELFC